MLKSIALAIPSSSPVPAGYFRSRLFSTHYTNNPLIAAAGPILSLVERLCVTPSLPEITHIRENIEHELFAFQSRLSCQNHPDDFIAIAHYLLCATIDELLGKNYLRLYGKNAEFKAFTPTSKDALGPEHHFFVMVDYFKERTTQYLDLLELAYYCLIAGFEGEFHVKADGRQALDNLIEQLHELILRHRAYQSPQLFKEHRDAPNQTGYYKPIAITSLVALFALGLTYLGSNSLLERQAKTLSASHYSSPFKETPDLAQSFATQMK